MLALGAPATGAVIGLIVGIGCSVYVARLDWSKVRAGVRARPEYRGSLVVVPALLAGLGALVGALFGALT